MSIIQTIMPFVICENPKINTIYKNISVNNSKEIEKQNNWNVTIPKISLNAQIKEGTTSEILNMAVAHFSESQYFKGNVCLAAHNRGYDVNYFSDLKELELGDEIIYEFGMLKLKYYVIKNEIIKDTDVYVIKNTKENQITLITCVENQPENRRCVIGKLKI